MAESATLQTKSRDESGNFGTARMTPPGSGDGSPEGEREVLDAVDDLGPAGLPQCREMGSGPIESDHALVFGDRDEERAVGIAVSHDCVDLEHGSARVRVVEAVTVVHDPFEHRHRDDSHETILSVDDPEVLDRLRVLGDEMVVGVARILPGWVERAVERIIEAWGRLDEATAVDARGEARAAGMAASARVVVELEDLFGTDVGDQRSTPLNIVRSAYREPTALLARLGIPGVVRDAFDERLHPDDDYDLAPRGLAELGDSDLGAVLVAWGITKAKVLRARVASPG